eukprot:COSAG06_NODE_634_length_13587_cov_23.361210_6_plen_551_part_00
MPQMKCKKIRRRHVAPEYTVLLYILPSTCCDVRTCLCACPQRLAFPMEHSGRVRADLLPERRLECLLEQAPDDWRWTPGAVTALLPPQWPGWARVQFDSGDALEVELPLESEGDAWRWADAAGSSNSDATVASQAKAPEMDRVCSICTDAFAEMPPDTAAVELPTCRHAFCEECLGGWWSAAASSGSNSCPDCRRVYSGLRRCPRSTAGAIAAASTSEVVPAAAPKRTVGLTGSNQAVDDEVESGEEEDCEPVAKRRKKCVTTSEYVGVSWDKRGRKWRTNITHDGKVQHLGAFHDEHEAARAVDTAARRLRGEDAHGGRSGQGWHRLNFPAEEEVKRAKDRGALLTVEDKVAAVAASDRQGPSECVGVCWDKKRRKWVARINHDGKQQNLGSFDDEHEAARAVDTTARRLRGDDAHGGQVGGKWLRLNFPTEGEVKRAQERGALLTEEDRVAAATASEWQGPSEFVGVTWNKPRRKWVAALRHDGKQQHLGSFDDEQEAARVVDTVARRLRGEDAHGGRAGGNKLWLRLNFPTKREAGRAKALGMPAAR